MWLPSWRERRRTEAKEATKERLTGALEGVDILLGCLPFRLRIRAPAARVAT